jgi:hypothetical protein
MTEVAVVKLSKNETAAVKAVANAAKTLDGLKADLKVAQGVVRTNSKLALTTAPKVVANLQKNAGSVVETLQQAVLAATAELTDAKNALTSVRTTEKAEAVQKAKDAKAKQREADKAAAVKAKAATAPVVAAAPAKAAKAPKAAAVVAPAAKVAKAPKAKAATVAVAPAKAVKAKAPKAAAVAAPKAKAAKPAAKAKA